MEENQQETVLQGLMEKELGRMLLAHCKEVKPDPALLENQAVTILEEVVAVLRGAEVNPDDQQLVEEILTILHRHNIHTGVCHEY